MLSIGLMSGTSMDGIDCALLKTDGTPSVLEEMGSCSLTYDPRFSLILKATEYAVRSCKGNEEQLQSSFLSLITDYCSKHHFNLLEILSYFESSSPLTYDAVSHHSTVLHARLVKQLLKQLNYDANQIDVIGYHGQTLYHRPQDKCSIMMGDPDYLARELGIKVIFDFRRNDINAGGQGAPFAPLYHFALAMRDNRIPIAIVNCGGISNISFISTQYEMDMIGFDTGPGNALVDSFVRSRTQGISLMDKNGAFGSKGRVHEDIISLLYEKSIAAFPSFYSQLPPKSLDYGDLRLIPEIDNLSLEDACATLEAFTADSIVRGASLIGIAPSQWVVAGGGWKNPVIYQQFVSRMRKHFEKDIPVFHADEIGWNAQALEAQIFAYFAVRRLKEMPISYPGTTKVPYPMIGGELFSPQL